MKNWIQDNHYTARYKVDKVLLEQLRGIIIEAWNAVPDSYIESLFDSWWERCEAVILARGGLTRY